MGAYKQLIIEAMDLAAAAGADDARAGRVPMDAERLGEHLTKAAPAFGVAGGRLPDDVLAELLHPAYMQGADLRHTKVA